jgi:hypothetical protein
MTNDKISFDKSSPIDYYGLVTFNFTKIDIDVNVDDFELIVPLQAIVCGFEGIVPRSGASELKFELTEDNQSQEYFTEFKINQLLKTSFSECYID